MNTVSHDTIFYDGECALCHTFVTFVVCRDRGEHFRFAPLGGREAVRVFSEDERRHLPDSVVVQTIGGTTLVKSEAVLYVLRHLPGAIPVILRTCSFLPRTVRDRLYGGIASKRKQVFGKSVSQCPLLPRDLERRFLE